MIDYLIGVGVNFIIFTCAVQVGKMFKSVLKVEYPKGEQKTTIQTIINRLVVCAIPVFRTFMIVVAIIMPFLQLYVDKMKEKQEESIVDTTK